MSVQGSKPGDLFLDASGNVFRVIAAWTEPVVQMERVVYANGMPARCREYSPIGGVSGLMWNGFRKLEPGEPIKAGGE